MGEGDWTYAQTTLADFMEALASSKPVPGGGSASAVAGSLAASLTVMVARLSLDRPKYAPYAVSHARAIAIGDAARRRLLTLADDDSEAYAAFSAALKLPRESDEERGERDRAVRAAARHAAEVPLEVVRECQQLVQQIESLSGRSNLNAASDLDVAALLAQAAARGAGANVITNLPMAEDPRFAGASLSELEGHLHSIESVVAMVHFQVRSGGLRAPEPG